MTSPEHSSSPAEPGRIAIVGTGLIGTSIAMAAARTGSAVSGFDTDPSILEAAAARSGLRPAGTLAEAVRGAELVFVCTPIATTAQVAVEVLAATPEAVVSDVGSVKTQVVGEVEAACEPRDATRFVGGHPMGGSERSGPDAASPAVLDGIVWVVSPSETTDPHATAAVEAFARSVGAQPVRMDPERHDRLVAMVSHLPQVASTALMGLAAREEAGEPEILLLAAGGFRDLTRLAGSSPSLWADILLSNRDALAAAIDSYAERLRELRDLVRDGRRDEVERAFAEAKAARLNLTAKPQVKAGVAMIQVPVPDRPGVLADLTASLGEQGVNIEDFQIVHSPEGGRGTVHVTVAAAEADAALGALQARGFETLRLA